LKILRATLFLPALLIPAVLSMTLYLALYTEQGSRSAVRLVQQLLPLEVEYDSGSLAGRMALRRVLFETEGLRLELLGVVAEVKLACLWRAAICFDHLQVTQLDIALPPDADVTQSSAVAATAIGRESAAALIQFPFGLEADLLEIERLRVHWLGGEWRQGSMRARIQLYDSTVEVLSASILNPRLTLQDTQSPGTVGSASTSLPVIDLPLKLSVTDLQLLNPSWKLYGRIYEQDKIALQGRWRRSELRVEELTAKSHEQGDLSLQGNLIFTEDWPIEADAVVLLAAPFQFSELLGNRISVSLRNNFSALEVQLDYPGTVAVGAHGQVNVLDSARPFSATVTATSATKLSMLDVEGVPTQLQGLALKFPLVMTVNGTSATQQFALQGAASGIGYDTLRIAMVGQHAQQNLVISELVIEDDAGANGLHASGEIALLADYPWALKLQSSGLDLPPFSAPLQGRIDGSMQLAGNVEGDQWQVEVVDAAWQGLINEMPASVTGFTGINSDLQLLGSGLDAQLNGAQLSLYSPGDAQGPGKLQLTIADLGRWQTGSSGQLELEAHLAPDREDIQLIGRLENVVWSGLTFAQAEIVGDYRFAQDHAFHLDAMFTEAGVGDIAFITVQFLAQGDWAKQSFTATASGDVEGTLKVTGARNGEQWRGALAPTRLQTVIGEWVLADAVTLSVPASLQQLAVDEQCWQHQYAQLCTGKWLLGAKGGGRVQLQSDLKIISGLLPADVAVNGDLSVLLDASWASDTSVRFEGSARTGDVTVMEHFEEGTSATFGWDNALATANFTEKGLSLDVDVVRGGDRIVGVELLLPPDRNDTLSGSVSLDRLKLGALSAFVPALSTLAGELSAQLTLAGTVDQLQAFGEISLSDGKVIAEGNPTELDQLDLNFDVQGDWASIRGSGIFGGGEVTFVGEVVADPELKLELTIEGTDQTVWYPPSTELRISEALLLTLKKDLLMLTGDISVHDGTLQIEALPQGSVALSSSVVVVDRDGNVLREELPFDVRMNLQIHIADRFKVTGNTLQTRLAGNLRVQQRPAQPLQLFGNLDLVGGEFHAYQTRLQIKRGTLGFTGPPDNPTVDVRAERHITSGDITVGVHVQGPLQNDLQLDVYSTPAMSQTNAMSYLVRGRGIDTGAGFDGTSTALSLASGVVNRSDLVAELNRIPGVSNIEFGAQGSEDDTAATVSGYLGERIYLSYGVGLYAPINVLTARFYLRSRFWLEVVSSLENSVDLYYSFDID